MIEFRSYGDSGPRVVLLHGGPGSPGYMAPVAQQLADSFRILEPFQRDRRSEPLTVAHHVQDLHELLQSLPKEARPALVGHSWGAMLALAYGAAHPQNIGPVVLISCGPFDMQSAALMRATVSQRMDETLMARLEGLADAFPDLNDRMREMSRLMMPIYSHDPTITELPVSAYDIRGGDETWQDMLRLGKKGVYPAGFAAIRSPVLMLHGASDPYPGNIIRASLVRYLSQLEYREWEQCGHYPWIERAVSEEFLRFLRAWLALRLR